MAFLTDGKQTPPAQVEQQLSRAKADHFVAPAKLFSELVGANDSSITGEERWSKDVQQNPGTKAVEQKLVGLLEKNKKLLQKLANDEPGVLQSVDYKRLYADITSALGRQSDSIYFLSEGIKRGTFIMIEGNSKTKEYPEGGIMVRIYSKDPTQIGAEVANCMVDFSGKYQTEISLSSGMQELKK